MATCIFTHKSSRRCLNAGSFFKMMMTTLFEAGHLLKYRPSSVLECLVDLQLTFSDISLILGVSRSTVCRRMRQQGLSHTGNYCCINDANLDEIVKAISAQHPGCGSKMMNGHLRAQGIIVLQIRIRESLRRTDPEGTAVRLRTSVHRRIYDVPAPQYMWHIDGNHKY